jgi:hypothetical protein
MGVKRKHLPPQIPMQPVETWIALACTRNTEENETPKRQPVQEDDPTPSIANTWSTLLPSICAPHRPLLTTLYTWQNLVRLISVSTVVLIKDQNGPYVASSIFPTYRFNIYPILIQIPCTLYNKPYITSIFFLIFI